MTDEEREAWLVEYRRRLTKELETFLIVKGPPPMSFGSPVCFNTPGFWNRYSRG